MLPGEGSDTDFPLLRLAVDIALGQQKVPRTAVVQSWAEGLLCGLGGGLWVRSFSQP